MNKLTYTIIALSILCFISCTKDEKDIFDETSAVRLNSTLQHCNNTLIDSPNGWVLEYYPEDSKYGGFHLYMTFSKNGMVTITSESPMLESANEKKTSQYQLKGDMGPVLSFDTYNRVLHQFSDPDSDGLGYEGDYEFIILKVDKDVIELKGKKNGVKMQMTRLPEGEIWEEYSAKIDTMIKRFPGFTMSLDVNGTIIDTEESDGIGRYLTFKLPEGVSSSTEGIAYVYTSSGIRFKNPVTIAGKTMQHFMSSEDGKSLLCVDEGVENVKIVSVPLAKAFVTKKGNWFFDPTRMGPKFTTIWTKLVDDLDKKGDEQLILNYFSLPSKVMIGASYSRKEMNVFYPMFYVDFIPEKDTDQLKIIFEGSGDEMTALFYLNYFKMFLSYITDDAPYSLTYNNSKVPNEIIFRRSDNPDDIWFVVTKFFNNN